MGKIVKRGLLLATISILAAFTLAAVNPQTINAPTDVRVSNTSEGHVLVRWNRDGAPVHRVGWTQEAEVRPILDADGDWLEAFHFVDTKRPTDYTVKFLPGGHLYWFIVGAGAERFREVSWSGWTNLTTVGSTPPTQPVTTPTPVQMQDGDAQDGGTIKMSAHTRPRDWDPLDLGSSSLNSVTAYSQLYNQLVQYDTTDTSAITGDLAERWDISADGLTYTFHLRDGMRWNDGRAITSTDVVYSLARYANPCTAPNGNAGLWSNYVVEIPATNCMPTNQQSVLRSGAGTVQISLRSPSPAFLKSLALDYVKVLPAHLLEDGIDLNSHENVIAHDSGSGPFILESYQPSISYFVNKNPNYFKAGRPYVDRIEHYIVEDSGTAYASFLAEQVDMANGGSSHLSVSQSLALETGSNGAYVAHPILAGINVGLMMNVKKQQFRDTRVRRAINLAVDRQELDEQVFENTGSNYCPLLGLAHSSEECLTWPGIRPKNTSGGQQDIAEAQRLMTRAGYPDGFEVQYTTIDTRSYSPLCRIVNQQLEDALGITGAVEVLPFPTASAKYRTSLDEEGDWEMACFGIGRVIYDPDDTYGEIYQSGGARNYTNWSNPRLDAWYNAQRVELDAAARRNINREAEQWLHEFSDNHWVTLQLSPFFWLVHRDVKGFNAPKTRHYGFKHEDLWLDR